MTNFRKAVYVLLNICFLAVLAVMPGSFFLRGNVYRQLPLYCFLERKASGMFADEDRETYEEIVKRNEEYLGEKVQREQKKMKEEAVRKEQLQAENKSAAEEEPKLSEGPKLSEEPELSEEPKLSEGPELSEEPKLSEEPEPSEEPGADKSGETQETAALPHPVIDLSPERLADADYLLGKFFIVDSQTTEEAVQLDAASFLEKDFSIGETGAQILIYHTHSQETFADSREGEEEDTVVGVGNYLAALLSDKYGYQVVHVKDAFDMMGGTMDRSAAYDYAGSWLEAYLGENPQTEVIIDLHRDGIPENRHLLTEINGKPTAQIMFYNGVSYLQGRGALDYLPNSYIEDNLAFSFQLEYEAAQYYPDFYRGIYLAGYRYNLHFRPRSLLIEAGAQTNTVQEVKNAMEPLADILNRVLKGGDK